MPMMLLNDTIMSAVVKLTLYQGEPAVQFQNANDAAPLITCTFSREAVRSWLMNCEAVERDRLSRENQLLRERVHELMEKYKPLDDMGLNDD